MGSMSVGEIMKGGAQWEGRNGNICRGLTVFKIYGTYMTAKSELTALDYNTPRNNKAMKTFISINV